MYQIGGIDFTQYGMHNDFVIENQTITTDKKNPSPDGDGIILSFKTNQLICVQRWVWKWADEAWPIEPKVLVEDWLEKREMVNKITMPEMVC